MFLLLKKMDSLAYVLNKIAINITVLAVAVMSVIVFTRVILRYGFGSGIPWAEEISILLMMWIAFFGGSILFYEKENIAVTIFKEKLSLKLNKILEILFLICTMTFMFILVRYGIDFAIGGLIIKFGATGLPRFWSYLSVPLGASFILYYSFIDLIKILLSQKKNLRE
ncbi:TRAP transporter small permease [Virgibacillus sp. W0181]|uniref:TRAP transporter small permease n=1 Tax=Virgibacillus sp. W0181 TaxID=3391581 RepID=UPI003F47721A